MDDLPAEDMGPQQDNIPENPEVPNPPMFSQGFVPNLHTGTMELDQLWAAAAIGDQPIILTMPQVRGTPINENSGHAIAIDAFPSLFPTGKADFTAPRGKAVTMEEWAGHLMHYKDGRFARHPRF